MRNTTVTDSDIRALLNEAKLNDDTIMAGLCLRALGEDTGWLIGTGYAESSPADARAECERVILDTRDRSAS
jgi:hypothetical protein